jgi:hypothetical protein
MTLISGSSAPLSAASASARASTASMSVKISAPSAA